MGFIYHSPLGSSSNSCQTLQCPPTPRRKRLVRSSLTTNNDPEFFPISSSVLGPSTCVSDSSLNGRISEESIVERMSRLPVLALPLKPQNKACGREAHATKLKLSASDFIDKFPPLPFAVSLPEQPTMSRSGSHLPEQVSASGTNANVSSTTGEVAGPAKSPLGRSHSNPEQHLPLPKNAIVPSFVSTDPWRSQPPFGRTSSDPEQFLASTRNATLDHSTDTVSRRSRSSSDPERKSASTKNENEVSSNKEKTLPIRRSTMCYFPRSRRLSLNAKSA
ncbi:hypothetical protein HJC23_004428 [Cyclotella cryptica]|uniref:Uncharacterized protein n=1 Tax=Cyclotella cryptica TaxID=29204 RepID=A0ABD3QF20_9STRA|eukprot:CCRYP_006036-RA/>CCRYP_006036-RA protein AED:0.38 eAED:0.38 QI:0/-1/0/1/-1/1/1/0/276